MTATQDRPDRWTVRAGDRDEAHDAWSRLLSSTHLPWSVGEIEADAAAGFHATVRRRQLADLVLVDCACDPCSGTRRPREIAHTDGDYLVMLMTLSGREMVDQHGTQSQLGPGSVVVWDSDSPAEFIVQDPLVKRSLIVPKTALAEVGARGILLTGTVLDQTSPAVTLLSGYLDSLARTLDDLPLSALPAARNATIELLAAALQDTPTGPPGHPTVVRAAAETHIDRNLIDPRLTPATVAALVGVSLRTLHRAFEGAEYSVAELIRTRRLARARDDLLAGRTVAQVAHAWNYSDASHFSRTFKNQFGYNPSELTQVSAET